MPRWLMRLMWAVRGKRLVRVHLLKAKESFEGVLVGRWSGHYVLLSPKLLVAADQTHTIDGHVEIPAENVLFIEVIGGGVR